MRVIKRYPNRKLYDTEEKRYVSLEAVAELVRVGEKVHIVDNATGEDLTALTLTQIIVEQEKRRSGFLPQTVLTGLIQAGGDTLGLLRRTLILPTDLVRQIDEEIERRMQVLVSRGELAESEARRLLDQLLARGRWPHAQAAESDPEVAQAFAKHGVPSREDFLRLLERLDALAAKLSSTADGQQE